MNDEEYKRLRQKQVSTVDEEARLIAKFEDESRDIMTSSKLSDGDKVAMLSLLRLRMEDLRKKSTPEYEIAGISKKLPSNILPTVPVPVAAVPAVAVPDVKEESTNLIDINSDVILSNIAGKNQPRAKKLLEIFKANPDILNLNEKFEIIADGHVIKNSNFLGMFDSFFGGKKKASIDKMIGIEKVLQSLKGITQSQKLISNSYFKKDINVSPKASTFESLLPSSRESSPNTSSRSESFLSPAKQTGTGKKSPGNNQRILRLYQV